MVPNSLEEGHDVGAAGADFLQRLWPSVDYVLLCSANLCPSLPGASSGHCNEAADDVDVAVAKGHQLSDTVLKRLGEPLVVLLLDESLEGGLGRDFLDQLLVRRQHVAPHPHEEGTFKQK